MKILFENPCYTFINRWHVNCNILFVVLEKKGKIGLILTLLIIQQFMLLLLHYILQNVLKGFFSF